MKNMNKETFKRNPIVSGVLRLVNPGMGYCKICGLPWNHCKSHVVNITKYQGCFAVCEHCYENSSYKDILNAHLQLWHDWEKDGAIHSLGFNHDDFIKAINNDIKTEI